MLEAVLWIAAYASHGDDWAGLWRIFFAVGALGLAALGWFAPRSVGLTLVGLGLLGACIAMAIVVARDIEGAAIVLILLPTAICPLLAGALFLVHRRSWA